MTDSWWNRAACKGQPIDLFFPPEQGMRMTTAKKEFCNKCPVTQQCLNDALKSEDPSFREGMFGGLTPAQRSRLARGFAPLRLVS